MINKINITGIALMICLANIKNTVRVVTVKGILTEHLLTNLFVSFSEYKPLSSQDN